MYSVSNEYIELAKSNIRPEIKPTITVSGRDADNNYFSIEWTSRNITEFTYKRGVDPLGRTLPYMELIWKERLGSRFTEEDYPERYNNVAKYMLVEFSLSQKLNFSANAEKQKISFPKMFLSARPTISGQTITWVARDIMFFLDKQQSKSFSVDIPFVNPMRWFLADERATFRTNLSGLDMLSQTDTMLSDFGKYTETENLTDLIVFEGTTKNILLNYASTRNCYWDFESSRMVLKKAEDLLMQKTPVFEFSRKAFRENPSTQNVSDVSSYAFKTYSVQLDEAEAYELTAQSQDKIGNLDYYYYVFKDLGMPNTSNGAILPLVARSTYAIVNPITVTPALVNGVENSIENQITGEVFNEDNPCNTYGKNNKHIQERFGLIKKYFNSSVSSVEINSLSNVALETGDIVKYPSNQMEVGYKTTIVNGLPVVIPVFEHIMKPAIVVEIELSYNGGLKQKTRLHEVNYDV